MLKSLCLSALSAGKGVAGYILNRLNTPVLVLIYHRVATLSHDPQLLAVAPENFRQHMRVLKSYPILRFEDDWGRVSEPSVVITFDDGYADNYLEALPILEEFDIPATFFVNVGNTGTMQEYWWDELERLILSDNESPETFVLADTEGESGRQWETQTKGLREQLYKDIHKRVLRSSDSGDCARILNELRQWRGAGREARTTHRPLTHGELKAMARHRLVTIGAHAVSHLPLASLSLKQQHEEITNSKALLEEWTGQDITVFSYPFGTKKDYSGATVDLARKAGFIKAAANFPGQWHSWTDNFQIPRQLVRNWGEEPFRAMLRKFWLS